MRGAPLIASFCAILAAGSLFATDGAFHATLHGDTARGPLRIPSRQRGSCGQCHDGHGSHEVMGSRFPHTLFAPDDNMLCFACHEAAGQERIFPGNVLWSQSAHALNASMVWPGPAPAARLSTDANKCVNCHTPHGAKDADGVIPSMLVAREEKLCTACHDGSRAPDVRTQFLKSYRHPIERRGRHSESEGADPSRYSAIPAQNRHSECADCHNPHVAQNDQAPPRAPDASQRITGVGRIEVTNSVPGSIPIYTWRRPDETSFAKEFEVCFKCHSSWTRQPPGQSNLALLTNPSNPSFHPIQANGKNPNIDAAAFTTGWSASSRLYCTDCHTSDDATVRGPHGSIYPHILKKQTTATTLPQVMPSTDLCFDCHSYDVYANPTAPNTLLRASRFNPPAKQGHAFHVGAQHIPCYSCHETHGSTLYPALIARGRAPGINSYIQTPNGGTCSPTCHQTSTYSVNYPR